MRATLNSLFLILSMACALATSAAPSGYQAESDNGAKDPAGGHWMSNPKIGLIHTDESGKIVATYPFPGEPVTAYPISPVIASLGNTLYVLSGGKLWSRAEQSDAWTSHDLPTRPRTRFDRDTLLVAIDGVIWIDVDSNLVRYDPASDTMRQWPFAASSLGPLGEVTLTDCLKPDHYIGAANGRLWFYTDSNTIELAGIASNGTHAELVETYVPNHGYSWLPTYAVLGRSLLWLDRTPEDGSATGKVLKWDFDTRQTTTVGYIPDVGYWQALFTSGDSIYVAITVRPSPGGSGDIYRYSVTSGDWSEITTPAHTGNVIPGYVDDAEALFEDAKDTNVFWRWNASAKSWTRAEAPASSWNKGDAPAPGNMSRYAFNQSNATRIGDSIYFANNHQELWRYAISKNQVSRVAISMPQPDGATIAPRYASSNSVWVTGEGPLESPIVGRLDILSGKWTIWDATMGLPADAPFNAKDEIAEDGSSAFVTVTLNRVFHLDPAAGRWENVTPQIDQVFRRCADYTAERWSMLSDPPYVWLCAPDDRVDGTGKFGLGPPVLVCWNSATGTFTASTPDSFLGRAADWVIPISVSSSSVWTPAAQGAWEFNKTTSKWTFHPSSQAMSMPKAQ